MTFNCSADTLDDLMALAIKHLLANGHEINPSKGPALETLGAVMVLTNPRARLSRSATRGRAFSCIGELSWYLNGSADVEHISHYLTMYRELAVEGTLPGAYGPRLFEDFQRGQLPSVIALLKGKKDSRQAVIQLFDRADLVEGSKDVPCTCTLQFFLREEKVELIVHMRSNDAYLGLPHDVFAFTMLQELVARSLGAEVGHYMHIVGSLHLYQRNREKAEAFLAEGWHSPKAMPPMPLEDPWASVHDFLSFEKRLRLGGSDAVALNELPDNYWSDLVRLLMGFAIPKDRATAIEAIRASLSDDFYSIYLSDRQDNHERHQ